MQTFMPYESFDECAKVLDNVRLNSQINEILVIIRSLTGVYDPNPRTGISGWAEHTVAKLWKGHELQLSRFALACSKELLLNRDLPKSGAAESLKKRKARVVNWQDFIEQMELRGCSDTLPLLIGDEDFHSAFRALLLYKDIQAETFRKWKRGGYPDHAVTRTLPPAKRAWKREFYENIWEFFGRPDPDWYGQWGWTEEPTDMLVFYTEDKIPQMQKEKQRKKDKPMQPKFLRALKK